MLQFKILVVLRGEKEKTKPEVTRPLPWKLTDLAVANSIITLYCQQQFNIFFSRLRVPTHLHHREAFSLYISKLYHKLFLYS